MTDGGAPLRHFHKLRWLPMMILNKLDGVFSQKEGLRTTLKACVDKKDVTFQQDK